MELGTRSARWLAGSTPASSLLPPPPELLEAAHIAHDLAEDELTLEEFDVLVHLAWARDGVLPLRALVASMVSGYQLSRIGLTRLLDRMERDGLVERSLSRADRRQFDVAITDRGREVFIGVWPRHRDGIERYFNASLTSDDMTALRRILAKVIERNEAPRPQP